MASHLISLHTGIDPYTITCYQIQSTLYRHQIIQVNRGKYLLHRVKPHANGHNIVGQQLPILSDVTCCICLHILLHIVGSCCTMFETGQTFSYVQTDATTFNYVRSFWLTMLCPFVQGVRDCRKRLLPLVFIKKTVCYRKESVRSGSTTHDFFYETYQWYSIVEKTRK